VKNKIATPVFGLLGGNRVVKQHSDEAADNKNQTEAIQAYLTHQGSPHGNGGQWSQAITRGGLVREVVF
jgi:hypothetical protein